MRSSRFFGNQVSISIIVFISRFIYIFIILRYYNQVFLLIRYLVCVLVGLEGYSYDVDVPRNVHYIDR